MSKKISKDILDEMTKTELIAWIREHVSFQRPWRSWRSWLLLHRWTEGTKKLQKEEDKERLEFSVINFSERDELARSFNAAPSNEEKLKILKLMEPYRDALTNHIRACDRFRARQKRLDKLYEQIDIELENEWEMRS